MTKLKKKRKKQAKVRFHIDELSNTDVYAAFAGGVLKSDKNWIPPKSYLWGLSEESFRDVNSRDGNSRDRNLLKDVFGRADSGSPVSLSDVDAAYQEPCLTSAVELLASVIRLAKSVDDSSPAQVAQFLNSLTLSVANDDADLLESDPGVHQLLYGEIPLTVALRFPQLDLADTLVSDATSAMTAAIEELLDGEGLPHARYLSQSGMLLAIWTRCFMLCDLDNRECFDVDAQTQFEFFVRQMIRLLRSDGTLVFSRDDVDLRKLTLGALKCYYDEDDRNIASYVFGKQLKSTGKGETKAVKKKKPSLNSLPEAAAYSEWAEVAILQTEWTPRSPKLIVDFHDRKVNAELSNGPVLFTGEIQTQFQVDGRDCPAASEWELVCWHSDQDGEFLELECDLENGAKWQKHFLLARNEGFCLIGDVLLTGKGKQIRIDGDWALGEQVGFGRAKETREMFLTHNAKTMGAMLPISIPEWQTQKTGSDVSLADGRLSYQCEGNGSNIYFPLFIDLDVKRCRKPLTWRQLTVAEQLEIVPASTAAAFRVHVGSQQWLVYRSLTSTENRTFIGQNLNVEFFVGTLEEDGTSSEIISVN